ncbi:MAG: ATP-dependent protease ATPase subunit HslU [Christensenellaceae bacterium]|jgi:ATP-dependent HslUV protease ATP-binding subunit HslU|nr:ATP-dependent protease ATPase subunit HslU [Christensenellaceae bacterium]
MKMELTPKQIVNELDRYIIGQNDAKKAVAIALRNRHRRSKLPDEIRNEITPKNIIMKGPTGVGKTEIARRLAKLVKAPFLKVEATKFTEVGYVGRDVESMIRDLVEVSIRLVKDEKIAEVKPKAVATAETKIAKALLPIRKKAQPETPDALLLEELVKDLKDGKLDKIHVELEFDEPPKQLQIGGFGAPGVTSNIGDIMNNLMPKRRIKRRMTVAEAYKISIEEAAEKLIDQESINAEGLMRAEQDGIVFIDELDKIASKGNRNGGGPDVSREGVQRDILPIVEGCTVSTKYGNIKTDYILFIAAGAFHITNINDLIPELQGRFPIIVDLLSLTEHDFFKILKEPDNALILQYAALLGVDFIDLKFTEEAIAEIARIAFLENATNENIGARRLHSVMEMLLEDISFSACGGHEMIELVIDKNYVDLHLAKTLKSFDLVKYIL